jgi:hypothetical protein
LTTRFMILSILFLLIGAEASAQDIVGAATTNGTNGTFSLKYIWVVTGLEPGQVITAITQENQDLYGAAKYEPDDGKPWNAIVVGSISGNDVDLVITPTSANEQSSFKMTGLYDAANQTIEGTFIKVAADKISARGNFKAEWINPDISKYVPATIEEPKIAASSSSEPASASASNSTDQTYQPQSTQESKFYDVHQGADRILTGVGDISQIPIGMGGSGLGGGSSLS